MGRLCFAVRGDLPVSRSFGTLRVPFLGLDTTSSSPTPRRNTFAFWRVSPFSDRQRLYAALVVELFAAGFSFTRHRALSSARPRLSPDEGSRRRTALAEPDEDLRPRIAQHGLWPDSRVGISRKRGNHPFKYRGSCEEDSRESFSVVPHRRETPWDRTSGLLPSRGIAPKSLPRTGQATLVASGSTGRAQNHGG